ncbi:hypothetical protein C1H46_004911 [Malus baccata]|uniref:2-isopropylmalate synthase n=1 Tax=Malus baccata TaxID=106549 RepID=A0A540NEF8_MALBA|nr:hypothetical protein C1H46_004911 [Malus baccata]
MEFLYRIYGETINAETTTITFTDTVSYNFPGEVEQFVKDLKANVVGIENAIILVHCHNDLGLANANTLAGAYAGARQVEVTINGIGERAGNASLEEDGILKNKSTYEIISAEDIGYVLSNETGIVLGKHRLAIKDNTFVHLMSITVAFKHLAFSFSFSY